jgi:hypothetical protein
MRFKVLVLLIIQNYVLLGCGVMLFGRLWALEGVVWLQNEVRVLSELLPDYMVSGSKVLTAVVMKDLIFLDITPCSLLSVYRSSGGICRLHLQDWRIIQARKQRESRLTFNRLHSVTSQKIELFINATVRIQNLKRIFFQEFKPDWLILLTEVFQPCCYGNGWF